MITTMNTVIPMITGTITIIDVRLPMPCCHPGQAKREPGPILDLLMGPGSALPGRPG
jgi:hypothetical protein